MNHVTINLSEHFTLAELTKTNTGIKNVPNEVHIENLKRLCGWLEKLRSEWNRRYGGCKMGDEPIIINSGYRSPQVNAAVGGVPSSNHLTGCAVDIHVQGMEQLLRYATILLDIADESKEAFDELLIERNTKDNYWIHFSVRPYNNRRNVRLMAL